MNYWTKKALKHLIKFMIMFGILLVIYLWVVKNKIPIPCFACEREGVLVKCTPGTGHGTHTCTRYREAVKRMADAEKQVAKIGEAVDRTRATFEKPIQEMNRLIANLGALLGKPLSLPPFPRIIIPPIDLSALNIDLSKIPKFDVGKDIIEPAVNAAITPINDVIRGATRDTKMMIEEINKALRALNIPALIIPPLPEIPPLNIKAVIDIAAELTKRGLDKINLGSDITKGLNSAIAKINDVLRDLEFSINMSTAMLSQKFAEAMADLGQNVRTIIEALRNQLASLNVFKDIIPEIDALIQNLSKLTPIDAVAATLLPLVQGLFPAARIVDVATIFFLFMAFGFLIYLFIAIRVMFAPIKHLFLMIFASIKASMKTAKAAVT